MHTPSLARTMDLIYKGDWQGVGEVMLDLAYSEDKNAGVDANVVMRAPESFVEVQGTGEQGTFSRAELDQVVDQAQRGISTLFELQQKALGW